MPFLGLVRCVLMHDSIHFCWPRWPHQSPMHSFTLSTSFAERCLTLLPRNGASCNEAHWDVVLFIHLSDLIALFPPLPSHLPVWLIYPVYFSPLHSSSCCLSFHRDPAPHATGLPNSRQALPNQPIRPWICSTSSAIENPGLCIMFIVVWKTHSEV